MIWPQLAPYVDDRVRSAAQAAGLPVSARGLRNTVSSNAELVRLEAALLDRRRQR